MIPVHMTTFGGPAAPPADRGDCFSACLASILEIPLADVPRFGELYGEDDDWQPHICEWLKRFGYAYIDVDVTDYTVDALLPHLGYCIVTGMSPRGHRHCVVGKGMEFKHDPHPSGEYLLPATRPATGRGDRTWQVGVFISINPRVGSPHEDRDE